MAKVDRPVDTGNSDTLSGKRLALWYSAVGSATVYIANTIWAFAKVAIANIAWHFAEVDIANTVWHNLEVCRGVPFKVRQHAPSQPKELLMHMA